MESDVRVYLRIEDAVNAAFGHAQTDDCAIMDAPPVAVASLSRVCAEALCRGVSSVTGLVMDWHYMGGRAVFRCSGDERAREGVRAMLWLMRMQAMRICDDEGADWPPPPEPRRG